MGKDKGPQKSKFDLEGYTERLVDAYEEVMRLAAFPTHSLIFLCRKFTEMSLIVFLEKHGHKITNEKYTLDQLLTRIKQSDEIKLPILVEKKIQTLRDVGNLASHASMERLSPLEMWGDIRSAFMGVAKWILQDELSLRPGSDGKGDFSSKELSKAEVVNEGFLAWTNAHRNAEGHIQLDLPLGGAALFQYGIFNTKMGYLAPEMRDFLDGIVLSSINNKDTLSDEELITIIGYTIRLAFMCPFTTLEVICSDYDSRKDMIESQPEGLRDSAKLLRKIAEDFDIDATSLFQAIVMDALEEVRGDEDTDEREME